MISPLIPALADAIWILVDLAILLGLILRLTRAVTVEDIGGRLLRWPAERWVERAAPAQRWKREWWADALSCAFCAGFHLTWLSTITLVLAGGPGQASALWRGVAGVFALSWLAGHLAARLDAAEDEPDNDHDPQHQDPEPREPGP